MCIYTHVYTYVCVNLPLPTPRSTRTVLLTGNQFCCQSNVSQPFNRGLEISKGVKFGKAYTIALSPFRAQGALKGPGPGPEKCPGGFLKGQRPGS